MENRIFLSKLSGLKADNNNLITFIVPYEGVFDSISMWTAIRKKLDGSIGRGITISKFILHENIVISSREPTEIWVQLLADSNMVQQAIKRILEDIVDRNNS